MSRRAVLGCGLLIGGFAAGWMVHARARTSEGAPKPACAEVSARLPEDFWIEMQTQRAMLRQLQDTCEAKSQAGALAAAVASAQPLAQKTAPASDGPPGAVTAPEDPSLMAAAQAIVDRAAADGKWTDDDAAALRASMADMTPAQRDKAMHVLLRALNEQGMRSFTHGPPF